MNSATTLANKQREHAESRSSIPAGFAGWLGLGRTRRRVRDLIERIVARDREIVAAVPWELDVEPSVRALRLESELASDLGRFESTLREQSPLVYAMLQDTLFALSEHVAATRRSGMAWRARWEIPQLLKVALARLELAGNWDVSSNATLHGILEGDLSADGILPHGRHSPRYYEEFYRKQDLALAARLAGSGRPRASSGSRRSPVIIGRHIDHFTRQSHAACLMETLIAMMARAFPGKNIQWIDIACGRGQITNFVDPSKYDLHNVRIIGADFQESRIAKARSMASGSCRFVVGDALEVIEQVREEANTIVIASMFEFLEHLEDPLGFLKTLSKLPLMLTVAGSPLDQRAWRPKRLDHKGSHLWTFSRAAFEEMFTLVGNRPLYSSEVRIGSHVSGLDWLTVAGAPEETHQALRAMRERARLNTTRPGMCPTTILYRHAKDGRIRFDPLL